MTVRDSSARFQLDQVDERTLYKIVPGSQEGYRMVIVGRNGTVWERESPLQLHYLQLGLTPPRGEWIQVLERIHSDRSVSVSIRLHGVIASVKVHDLVASLFIGACPPGMEVYHRNEDPSNNHLSNLTYGPRRPLPPVSPGLANAIRKKYARGRLSISTLAIWYDLDRETVEEILSDNPSCDNPICPGRGSL